MDTKWKRWKTVVSFLSFAVGISMLLFGLCIVLPAGAGSLSSTDYQDSAAFRAYISEELDCLLSAAKQESAVGGHWDSYEFIAMHDDGSFYAYGTDRGAWALPMENAPNTDAEPAEIPQKDADAPVTDADIARAWDDYMAYMAPDRNLLYAVVRDGRLLYTNIDGLTAKSWNGNAFETVDDDMYNFFLSFNRNGDGKAEIVKNGMELDVYGDGWYTSGSDWCLPGYNNFTVDAGSAEIYLAVAGQPQLYLTTDADGTSHYAGYALRDIYHTFLNQTQGYSTAWIMLVGSAPLLLLALVMHRSKHRGDRFLIRLLGKIWFMPKFLLLFGGAAFFLLLWLSESDGLAPLLSFWLLYLGLLDLIGNRGRQKMPLRDCFRALRVKTLALPVQQRLARRNRLMVVYVFVLLLVLTGSAVLCFIGCVEEDAAVVLLGLAGAAVSGALFVPGFRQLKPSIRLTRDIGSLAEQISRVRGGNLTDALTLPEDADLRRAAEELNDIQQGLQIALSEQMKSERMKVELITNVSHDIKTPLTSIISYIELLKQEEGLPEHVQEFIAILGEKSQRLKVIVQDVFEVSKAAAGQLPLNMEPLDLAKLLRQTLADMAMSIEKSGLAMRLSIPEEPVMIQADGQRLYRVFQNLLQNALQYSLPGSRVFLTLTAEDGSAAVQVKNTSAAALDDTVDFTERFVRGDESRTDGGSGLGLSIAKSFTEACGGNLNISIDADLFTVTVTFTRA